MKLTKRQNIIAGILTALLVAGAVAVAITQYPNWLNDFADTDATAQVDVTDVLDLQHLPVMQVQQSSSFTKTTIHSASVQSRSKTMSGFPFGGKVLQLLVDEGSSVIKGEPIAIMDSRGMLAQEASLKAQLLQGQAVLEELKQGPRAETIDAVKNEVMDLEEQFKAQELSLIHI